MRRSFNESCSATMTSLVFFGVLLAARITFVATQGNSVQPTCPSDIVKVVKSSQSSVVVSWVEPSTPSGSGTVRITSQSFCPGDSFSLGRTPVTYTFSDDSGNTSYCEFFVIVTEVNCPRRAIIANATGHFTTVQWKHPFPDESSTNLTGEFEVGVTSMTYQQGQFFCTFSVIVKDVNPPRIDGCYGDVNKQLNAGKEHTVVHWEEPRATDVETNNVSITSTHKPGDVFTEGVTHVVYSFEDDTGNEATCSFNVHVTRREDTTAPVVHNCPRTAQHVAVESSWDGMVSWNTPNATDDSGEVSVTVSHEPGDRLSIGVNTIVYAFTDKAGNMAICQFKIIVEVTNKPSTGKFMSCPDDISVNVSSSGDSAEVIWTNPEFVNGTASVTQSHHPGDSFDIGKSTVLYNATDDGKIAEECRFVVNVNDVTPPSVSGCPSNKRAQSCRGPRLVYWLEPVPVDNSNRDVQVIQTHSPSESLFRHGSTNVSYFFKDNSGNVAECKFNVVVHKMSCGALSSGSLLIIAICLGLFIVFLVVLSCVTCRCSEYTQEKESGRGNGGAQDHNDNNDRIQMEVVSQQK